MEFDPTFNPLTSPTRPLDPGAGLNAALSSVPFTSTRISFADNGLPLAPSDVEESIWSSTSPPLTNSAFVESARSSNEGAVFCCAATGTVRTLATATSPIAAKRFIAVLLHSGALQKTGFVFNVLDGLADRCLKRPIR